MILFKLVFFASITLFFFGCSDFLSSDISKGIADRVSLGFDGPDLPVLCDPSNNQIYSGITVSGKAEYEYRIVSQQPGSPGLREVSDTPRPIRKAEYVVENLNGETVYCGFTNDLGSYSFNLPLNNQTYKLIVKSRDETFANVMRAPETNDLYTISRNFSASSDQLNFNLLALADDEKVTGAAFNILDQIYASTKKIEELTNTLSCNNTNCLDISSISKADIYWEAGFNPGSYLQGNNALSFYSIEFNRVFILGGLNGDIDFSDTDHFDNSIIIHEYFHFLESALSKTNSPGGSHNGNQLLDPRLAWSEGVAQFFQALVTDIPAVLDTRGNIDGDTDFFLNLSIEDIDSDLPLNEGEGDFREFSVARTLWDLYDTNTDPPYDFINANNTSLNFFNQFWQAFTGNNDGFNNPSNNFRSISLLNKVIENNLGTALDDVWKDVLEQEEHFNGRSKTFIVGYPDVDANPLDEPDITYVKNYRGQYGSKLNPCVNATEVFMLNPFFCNSNYTGSGVCVDNNSIENHHLVQNSDYYHLSHSGGSLKLTFTDESFEPSGVKADLDIYVYKEGYAIDGGVRSTPFASSTGINQFTGSGEYKTPEEEIITSLPAGDYLVQIFIRNFSAATKRIGYSFENLCPETSL